MDETTSGSKPMKEKVTQAKDTLVDKKAAVVDRTKAGASTVKEKVTTATGAVKAFVDEAKKEDIQGKTKEAMHTLGDATRDVSQTAKEETRQTKESAKASSTTSTDSTGSGTSSGVTDYAG